MKYVDLMPVREHKMRKCFVKRSHASHGASEHQKAPFGELDKRQKWRKRWDDCYIKLPVLSK